MPSYAYDCPHCEKPFMVIRTMGEAAEGPPPCTACGFVNTRRVWLKAPRVTSDIPERFFHHGLGRTIGSNRELRSAMKETREKMYWNTDGPHTTKTPHKIDPADPDSKVVWENETFVREGFDMGELYPLEKKPEVLNEPMSAFDPGKTLRQSEQELERKLA